jgi:hypothetical protein
MRESGRFAVAVAALAAVGGVLLIAAEFSTVTWVDVADQSCEVINDANPNLADRCKLSGFERHGGAFVLLGVFAVLMGWGAGTGASRPAALALVATGLVVLGVALFRDLPESGKTGAIGPRFAGAEGKKGTGLYLELAGGLLAVGAGAASLLQRGGRRPEAEPSARRPQYEEPATGRPPWEEEPDRPTRRR